MSFIKELEHLRISIDEIKSATNNFADESYIGQGGFGKVYKGELLHSEGRSMVAIKRLDRLRGQGDREFLMEITMLSRYRHKNLVSLLGYCDEGSEKMLVYEHMFHGSLDRYLSSTNLTWLQRLKICLGAAYGLNYLHNPKESQQRVLHRDIKSSNILLDRNWEAKISDFGLSKVGPANQMFTFLVSDAVGTPGYCDPLYMETGFLTKESDVYSFGVMLFEVLCGKLCSEKYEDRYRNLVPLWQQSYEDKKLYDIIDANLSKQIDMDCLDSFSKIAYQCLSKAREERPKMSQVVKELQIALDFQESCEDVKKPIDYEEIIQMGKPPPLYSTKDELSLLLSKGILVNSGKTWFSVNKNGQSCEMISATTFAYQRDASYEKISTPNSRFLEVAKMKRRGRFIARVRTQFLSPGLTYAIYLVFKYSNTETTRAAEQEYAYVKYFQQGTKHFKAYLANRRDDGWLMTKLYQFTTHKKKVGFQILFQVDEDKDEDDSEDDSEESVLIEGLEFCRIENVTDEKIETSNGSDMNNTQIKSSFDADWEQKLPSDYQEIIKRSTSNVSCTTKKEIYILLSNGILINKLLQDKKWSFFNKLWWKKEEPQEYQWFSLDENGKKCLMLPMDTILPEAYWYHVTWQPLPDSRFSNVANFIDHHRFRIHYEIKSEMLSPNTSYAGYFIYKVPKKFVAPVIFTDLNRENSVFVYLVNPEIPIIELKHDQRSKTILSIPKPYMKGHPRVRHDGWMEVQVWEFTTSDVNIMMALDFYSVDYVEFNGLIVEGIEFRPI